MDTAIARKRLEEMLGGIDRSIAVLKGESPDPGGGLGYPLDPADAGSNLAETDRTEAILESAQRQRGGVLAALRRMDEGKYGLCADCGKPVPDSRLQARPDAARCVGCQSKHDRLRR